MKQTTGKAWYSRERERESYILEDSVSKASVACYTNKYCKLKSYT